ncbi:hypothetical protein [Nocardia anaemiae]|uniref:hypothetical protein n=1 Tax=Nocardia anaemiae TaxID=263910 RepID=UPI000B229128|nr:hypothetical protein [Nocardia anaemiae]
MSVAELVCEYCSHRNIGNPAQCGHCGAPLSAVRRLSSLTRYPEDVERVVVGAERAVAATGDAVAGAENAASGAEKLVAKEYPRWQWGAAIAAIVTMVLGLGFTVVRSCSTPLSSMADLGVDQALPSQLRAAASCQPVDSSAENCVVPAADPMLAGGITGGRDLTLSVALDPPERRADTVRNWRTAGGTVLADGVVFVAISPSATLRYANTLVGLRVETGAFTGRAAAQTFMSRSGLTP